MSGIDNTAERVQRAVVVGRIGPEHRDRHEPPLAELRRLAHTAGAEVVAEVTQKRERPAPAYYVGKGKAEEVSRVARAFDADMVLFDNDLSPAQERNLAQMIGLPVIDRSRLILDIFATRARTRQARLQVELAQLRYTRSRLTRMWSHLERERLEGAIGTRGPGEKQLETDRRLIDKRIQQLRRQLDEVERRQRTRAAARESYYRVSLVGYTNAGKSTLLQRLSGADTFAEDKLFATLDTQTRAWELPGNLRVFVADTVGFIRDLPHHLVASFQSTLAEAADADLLLVVVDASNPDAQFQLDVVREVLHDIGARDNERLLVFNKIDAVENQLEIAELRSANPQAIEVSARTGDGIGSLERRVAAIVGRSRGRLRVEIPLAAGRLLAYLEERVHIVSRDYGDESVAVELEASPSDLAHIRRELAECGGVVLPPRLES